MQSSRQARLIIEEYAYDTAHKSLEYNPLTPAGVFHTIALIEHS
jgi:hypothetical protein